jgi:hypothetical protein
VNGLEQRLHDLGAELAYPPQPDLAPTVLARLDRRPFPWRRAAIVAFAVIAIAVAAAFAVPQARTALLRWFHIRGATVERVQTLPPAVERSDAAGLGRPVSRAQAERELGFRLALPSLGGAHPRVYVLEGALATVILHAYGKPVLLSEFRPTELAVLKKLVGAKAIVEPVTVDGAPGLWLEGPPHTLTYFGRQGEFREKTVRIHGNVLLWTRGRLTLRLEGRLSKAQALAIAHDIG